MSDPATYEPKTVLEVVQSRRSVRAFLADPVERAMIDEILIASSRAPSGSNIQPWKVHVLRGSSKEQLSRKVLEVVNDPQEQAKHSELHPYYPKDWKSPYLERRRALGWGLYSLLSLTRENKAGMKAQHARNFTFFDAPVGLLFTTDCSMERGSWLDLGMFMQNIMLLAKARGLDTCPQAAFNAYHRVVSEHLGLSADEILVGAMSLGFADLSKIENTLESERAPLESFVRYHD
ncbi:nitroreductase [Pseudomonas sp. GD03817]|uniref:nitroreductase n=1 Tax=Pseudomonas TaxID=286 RepID=UPI0010C0657D|nr:MULTISPECIES: nitroreductase [Pseudomonas]MCE0990454.1 nitroreductase [Pseudomonas alloputida]MDH1401817.1 nitroreductase [Pseudomonas sp. GD03730]MDH1776582.1 nitroreductase [Pseudomonas sp. GD03817]MEE1915467.1 nitroreductase [Pseudomonas asiatica]WNI08366.1 nitroreductase [Pseudomonas putida]